MRSLFISFLFLFAVSLQAQTVTTNYILSGSITSKAAVNEVTVERPAFFVRMNFGSAVILNPAVMDSIKKYHIQRVDLVYSSYKNSESFSQSALNKNRLEALKDAYPLLFDNNVVQWRLIEQTGGASVEEAKKLFHGFIVYVVHKKITTKEKDPKVLTTEAEIKIIKETLAESATQAQALIDVEVPVGASGYYRYDSAGVRTTPYRISSNFIDSVVLNYFNRNQLKFTPDKVVLVEDVTGSMYPYTAQTLMWRRAHEKLIRNYIFFNDGDNKPDKSKAIGSTGGVYYYNTDEKINLEEKVYNVMRKGNGGDCAENNVEALLSVQKYCPQCDFIIMIADNYAPIKDISLLKKMNKPVHIILCGYDNNSGVQESYIRLAYETGGSINTMNKNLMQYKNLKEGDVVEIGNQKFSYTGGRFVLTR